MNITNSVTHLHKKDGVWFLTFPVLEKEGICHGFSTRIGGVSTGFFSSMNLSFHRQDDPDLVRENHRRFAQAVGYDADRLVFSDQVHGTDLHVVTKDDAGKGIVRDSDIRKIDGLLTNEPEIPLITLYADCVPLYYYDPVQRVVALAHSGWRGTVSRIGACMTTKMKDVYGCRPENILCVIGPSICQDCYEVSEDVAEQFKQGFPEKYHSELLRDDHNGKYHLKLQAANKRILLDAGIRPEHMNVADLCTCCNPELLFSHRASGGRRGNLAAVIMLKG